MKIICKFSNVEYDLPQFHKLTTGRWTVEGEHPVFLASTGDLIDRMQDWYEGKLDDTERKLLFLAFLRTLSTEVDTFDPLTLRKKTVTVPAVRFECAAFPSPKVVNKNIERLSNLVIWQQVASAMHIRFPVYKISHSTRDLESITSFLDELQSKRTEFYDKKQHAQIIEQIRVREEKLDRLLKSVYKPIHKWHHGEMDNLAKWVMDVTNVPLAVRPYWVRLFHLKEMDLYNEESKNYEELVDHMERNLPANSSYANTAFSYIRILAEKNKKGLYFALGASEFKIIDEDTNTSTLALSSEGQILTSAVEDVETHNTLLQANQAPEARPLRSNYQEHKAGKLQFLLDEARWEMKQEQLQKMQTAQTLLVAKMDMIQDTLDEDAADSEIYQETLDQLSSESEF